MTVLFVGDIHLKSARVLSAVDRAVAMTGADGVVFLGDICDDWGATAREAVAAVRMFADWVHARRAAGLDVTVLAGNHDLPYLARPRSPEFHWFRREADGFKPRAHEGIHDALAGLDMRMAWRRGRVLATHAGVTADWAAWAGLSGEPEADLDRMPHRILFDMAGPARGGRSTPSPVWADRTELEADPWAGWTQVVGHTPVPTVTNAGGLWFCDTWTDGDGSMLLLSDDGSFAPVRPQPGRMAVAVSRKGAEVMSVNEIIEYLRTLPKDAIVRVLVMDKALGHLESSVVEDVVDGDVWCREDIGTLIEDNGKNPAPEKIDKVLAAVPDGLGAFGDRLAEEGWNILHGIYDDAIDAL